MCCLRVFSSVMTLQFTHDAVLTHTCHRGLSVNMLQQASIAAGSSQDATDLGPSDCPPGGLTPHDLRQHLDAVRPAFHIMPGLERPQNSFLHPYHAFVNEKSQRTSHWLLTPRHHLFEDHFLGSRSELGAYQFTDGQREARWVRSKLRALLAL